MLNLLESIIASVQFLVLQGLQASIQEKGMESHEGNV